mgnify:CR=1 FL=1
MGDMETREREAMQLTDDTMQVECRICKDTHILMVNIRDAKRWRQGELIQDAMPYLTPDERELLISETCKKCFDKMFGEDPIGDADTEYDIEFEDDA